jgi:methylmalonyl-CoA mutase C-terminal domain/subunit
VETAIQEDVDVIGLSILSGAHTHLFSKVMELLKENNIKDIIVMGGGVIPEEDIPELKKAGVAEIFTPGTDTRDIIKFIEQKVK